MPEIRLNKKNKTVKVVNRNNSLRLQHTGKTGLKGDKGDTGESTFVRVHHGSNASVARPDAVFVEWVGSVAPLNATTEDTWIDIA